MSVREAPKDYDKSFPETEEQAERRRVVESRCAELTSRIHALQTKAERERTHRFAIETLLRIRERAQSIETHFHDCNGTKQPHTAKGAIKDFVAIVEDELAKVSSSE